MLEYRCWYVSIFILVAHSFLCRLFGSREGNFGEPFIPSLFLDVIMLLMNMNALVHSHFMVVSYLFALRHHMLVGFEMEMKEPLDQPIKQFFASMWLN